MSKHFIGSEQEDSSSPSHQDKQDPTDQPSILQTLETLNELSILAIDLQKAGEFAARIDEIEEEEISCLVVQQPLLPQGNRMPTPENTSPREYWKLLIDLGEKVYSEPLTKGTDPQSAFHFKTRLRVLSTLKEMNLQDWKIDENNISLEYIERLFDLLVTLKTGTYLESRKFSFLTPLLSRFRNIFNEKQKNPDNTHNLGSYHLLLDPLIEEFPELEEILNKK